MNIKDDIFKYIIISMLAIVFGFFGTQVTNLLNGYTEVKTDVKIIKFEVQKINETIGKMQINSGERDFLLEKLKKEDK